MSFFSKNLYSFLTIEKNILFSKRNIYKTSNLHISSYIESWKDGIKKNMKEIIKQEKQSAKRKSFKNIEKEKIDGSVRDKLDATKNNPKRMQQNFAAKRVYKEEDSIILFPGQGTQYEGMGQNLLDIPAAKKLFNKASDILSYDLLGVCNSSAKLGETLYQQPAIFVASLAALEKLKEDNFNAFRNCVGTAGLSLGEITSLVFAEVLSFEDGLKLVEIRAEAMNMASLMTPGRMMFVYYDNSPKLHLGLQFAAKFCQETNIEITDCKVANYLFPGCRVISGNVQALKFLQDRQEEFDIKVARTLNVSGAFHTALMQPAVPVLEEAVKNIHFNYPIIPVYNNWNGKQYKDVKEIRYGVCQNIVRAVRWEQLMHTLYDRKKGSVLPHTYECGPGKSLGVILNKCNRLAGEQYTNISA